MALQPVNNFLGLIKPFSDPSESLGRNFDSQPLPVSLEKGLGGRESRPSVSAVKCMGLYHAHQQHSCLVIDITFLILDRLEDVGDLLATGYPVQVGPLHPDFGEDLLVQFYNLVGCQIPDCL